MIYKLFIILETKKENNIANEDNSFFGFIKKLFINNEEVEIS